ncbi:MAG: DUF1893 domain-containing protein [Erysipelotrichaceae bacterium]|nr:DUF1893 domain-containing protein [Erysipelotrichaceae bacterium]MBR2599331.1 DUF1893 domain-containing protein [Erysipelotrichaceae bacterium]
MTDNITCTVIQGDQTHVSDLPGLRPLMNWLHQSPEIFEGSYVIDKVVGKASAMLLTYGGARKIHGKLMSRPADEFLTAHRIEHTYDVLTDYILNQDQSDMCPMEKRVKDLKEPEEAFAALKPIFIKE